MVLVSIRRSPDTRECQFTCGMNLYVYTPVKENQATRERGLKWMEGVSWKSLREFRERKGVAGCGGNGSWGGLEERGE